MSACTLGTNARVLVTGVALFLIFPPPQPLPASIQPVFSMAMHGVVACFTHAGSKETRVSRTLPLLIIVVMRVGVV